ncbi:Epimerase family protein [Sinobacterium norvegicum]|uniref:Epimerase family protein n=1 Tax=Sinobacterium norvegicum TaxID=1641715 RepID=A0ABN8EJX7_9GAMM|nr:TIGR01777 family oxidoreductase [Sinobacterium norvegicum]CAH0991692.1 Epimerase family protein [Sinobacterium norvegicum]
MRVLLTGGTGLIGRELVGRLKRNHQLVIVSRQPRANEEGVVYCPLEEFYGWQQLNDIDAVINLAGEPIAEKRWTSGQKEMIVQSRWRITDHIAKLITASETPPSVFISGSAIGIYGNSGSQVVDENSAQGGGFPQQVCERWESLAKTAADSTRVVILRTGIVMALEGGVLGKVLPIFKLGGGGRLGSGQQYMSWVSIDDAVSAIEYLMLNEHCQGVFNITAPTAVTNAEFTRLLAGKLKRPGRLPMPAFILKKTLGELSCLMLDSQNVAPRALLEAGFVFKNNAFEDALDQIFADRN